MEKESSVEQPNWTGWFWGVSFLAWKPAKESGYDDQLFTKWKFVVRCRYSHNS